MATKLGAQAQTGLLHETQTRLGGVDIGIYTICEMTSHRLWRRTLQFGEIKGIGTRHGHMTNYQSKWRAEITLTRK